MKPLWPRQAAKENTISLLSIYTAVHHTAGRCVIMFSQSFLGQETYFEGMINMLVN